GSRGRGASCSGPDGGGRGPEVGRRSGPTGGRTSCQPGGRALAFGHETGPQERESRPFHDARRAPVSNRREVPMNRALHRVAASAVAVGLAFGITASLASARTAAVGVESGHTSSDAATWKPWHLSAADQFRLPAPPAARSATTKSELKEILRAEAKSTAKMRAVVKKWNAQPAIS